MDDSDRPFEPDWASPPGDTILDLMEVCGVDPESMAGMEGVLDGTTPITLEIAKRLVVLFPTQSVEFWLHRERKYRKNLRRLERVSPSVG